MKLVRFSTVAAISAAIAVAAIGGVQAHAEDATMGSDSSVKFAPSSGVVKPIDPIVPGNPDPEEPEPPKPGTEGPLSIDYASDFKFGSQQITTKDMTYKALPQTYKNSTKLTPNFVQITDTRGTNAGWTLNVKQNGQFNNQTTQNKELTGAVLKFAAGEKVTDGSGVVPSTYVATLDPSGAYSKVMTAKVNEGTGTWVSLFGGKNGLVEEDVVNAAGNTVKEKRDSGVTLSIPGTTQTDAVEYATTLTWQLTNTPGN